VHSGDGSGEEVLAQIPEAGSHVATSHGSFVEQSTGSAPTQTPAKHTSVRVQAFPSSHDEPSSFAV
jgi:hypothetical protein